MRTFNLFSGVIDTFVPVILPVPKRLSVKHFVPLADDQLRAITDRNNPVCPFYRRIGQDTAIEQLLAMLVDRMRNDTHSGNNSPVMFTGPASTGKTTFASLLFGKKGLDLPYVQTDAKKIKGTDTIFSLLKSATDEAEIPMQPMGQDAGRTKYICPPMGLLIDELHGLPAGVMDNMLKALESTDCQLITQNEIVDCRNLLWLGATTQRGEIVKKNEPFDSRWEKIEFRSYTKSEVTQIISLAFGNCHGWDLDCCEALATRGGCIVREALAIGQKVTRQLGLMRLRDKSANIMDAIAEVGNQMGVDESGMSDKQLAVLRALARRSPKGMSYPQMARVINRTVRELQEVVLPGLQLESADVAPKIVWSGYTHITEAGFEELKKRGLRKVA